MGNNPTIITQLNARVSRNDLRISRLEKVMSTNGNLNTHSGQDGEQPALPLLVSHLQAAVDHLRQVVTSEARRRDGDRNSVKSLARALLLACHKTEPAIKEAVEHFLDVKEDIERFEEFPKHLTHTRFHDLLARWQRQLIHRRKDLDDLGVEIVEVPLGSTFDPKVHKPVQQAEAREANQINTIARVMSPLFVWRDEFGQEQYRPAEVVVYGDVKNAPERARGLGSELVGER